MSYTEYRRTLPLAKKIYNKLYDDPKTHREWAESFNIIGDINEVLNKTLK